MPTPTSKAQKVIEEGAEKSASSEILDWLRRKLWKSPKDKMMRPWQVKMK
jgi:hypothetical protein